jgi:hypothetical protein
VRFWLILVAALGACQPSAWVPTGDRSAFPSLLAVSNATAITIDATFIYWITTDGFLYRAPRSSGDVARIPLPAPGTLLGAHNDLFVGWTDTSGNAAIADIDPPSGMLNATNQLTGHLRGLVAGQHGYSFASGATQAQTCLNGVCTSASISSAFKSLALDLPTKTFYVLTTDGLRICSLSNGCPPQAAATSATLIAALPSTYFLVDDTGQASSAAGNLGTPAVATPTKLIVVDGNGHTPSPVGTWSNGTTLAQTLLDPTATTNVISSACTDFDVDATGRPIYCLVGNSSIQVIP